MTLKLALIFNEEEKCINVDSRDVLFQIPKE